MLDRMKQDKIINSNKQAKLEKETLKQSTDEEKNLEEAQL